MISGILKEIRLLLVPPRHSAHRVRSDPSPPLAIYQDSYHRNEIIYCIKTTSRRRGRKRKTGGRGSAILELADKKRKALAPLSFVPPLSRDFILFPEPPSSRILRETSAQFSISSFPPLFFLPPHLSLEAALFKLNCRYLSNDEINKLLTFPLTSRRERERERARLI